MEAGSKIWYKKKKNPPQNVKLTSYSESDPDQHWS